MAGEWIREPRARAGERERELVVSVLREASSRGQLSAPELDQRWQRLRSAQTVGDLVPLVSDLPNAPAVAERPTGRRRAVEASPEHVRGAGPAPAAPRPGPAPEGDASGHGAAGGARAGAPDGVPGEWTHERGAYHDPSAYGWARTPGYEQPGYGQSGYEQPGHDSSGYDRRGRDQLPPDQPPPDRHPYGQSWHDRSEYARRSQGRSEPDSDVHSDGGWRRRSADTGDHSVLSVRGADAHTGDAYADVAGRESAYGESAYGDRSGTGSASTDGRSTADRPWGEGHAQGESHAQEEVHAREEGRAPKEARGQEPRAQGARAQRAGDGAGGDEGDGPRDGRSRSERLREEWRGMAANVRGSVKSGSADSTAEEWNSSLRALVGSVTLLAVLLSLVALSA